MNVLFEFLKSRLSIDRVGLAYVDYQSQTFVAEYGVLKDQETVLGPGFVQPFNETSLSEVLRHQQPVIDNDIEQTLKNRPRSAALNMLKKEQIKSNLTIPIIMNKVVFGFIFLSSYKKGFFNHDDVEVGKKVADEVKTLLNRAYFTNVILTKMTSAFSEIVENKDNDTGDHILRMVKYSSILARAIKARNHQDYQISEKTILEVERYAAVHDIGKVGIPDALLKKEGKLSDQEWDTMKTHPQIGADVFKNLRVALNAFDSGLYQVAEDITRYHHERWDGLGYPHGLKEHDIPLVARIVSVADVFDALSSKRSYKRAFTFDESVKIIIDASNTQLDPFIVQVFLEEIEQIKKVYQDLN
jgi:response regulator RpfG family c-di-GMP phosphodiesterase